MGAAAEALHRRGPAGTTYRPGSTSRRCAFSAGAGAAMPAGTVAQAADEETGLGKRQRLPVGAAIGDASLDRSAFFVVVPGFDQQKRNGLIGREEGPPGTEGVFEGLAA